MPKSYWGFIVPTPLSYSDGIQIQFIDILNENKNKIV